MLPAIGQIQAQRPAVLGLPLLIQIEHRRHRAAVVIAKTIEMPLVEGPGA